MTAIEINQPSQQSTTDSVITTSSLDTPVTTLYIKTTGHTPTTGVWLTSETTQFVSSTVINTDGGHTTSHPEDTFETTTDAGESSTVQMSTETAHEMVTENSPTFQTTAEKYKSDTTVSAIIEETQLDHISSETTTVTAESMTEEQKRAYALGANSAGFLARSFPEFDSWGMSVDRDLIKQGFIDMLEDKAVLSKEEMQTVLMKLQSDIQAKIAEVEKEQSEKAMAANKTFMEAHAAEDGVMVTESGLQYRIVEEGTGPNPGPDDIVRVHYKGTLVDGSEFDSSYSRGEPIGFPLGRVIPGWVEGIQLVKEGGKIELVMGPELGYGSQATPTIPANSALKFEVELLKINPEPEAEEEPAPAEETETEQ